MRGFLSLEPDAATRARLVAAQNRLRDALTRQGVSFPDRLGVVLLAWPFGTDDQLSEATERLLGIVPPPILLRSLDGRPNADRPAEAGFVAEGLLPLQDRLFADLRVSLDPDPPKPAFVRLVRISPPSRKVGAALRSAMAGEAESESFGPDQLVLWRQSPQGFEVCRTMPLEHERR